MKIKADHILVLFITFLLGNLFVLNLNAINVEIKQQKSNFLYGAQATITGDITRQNGDFFPWKGNAEMAWNTYISADEKYDIYLIAGVHDDSKNLQLQFISGNTSFDFTIQPTTGWVGNGMNFQRIKIGSAISFQKGEQKLVIKSSGITGDKILFNFRSVELVPLAALPAIEKERKKAEASRADTEWLVKKSYGLMFHWTSQSVNADGSNKPYEQAVNEFDVVQFANMVEETGAGYVIFTIGHAEQYCPAPIKSWEKCHPGKTTKRDLIREIADELNKKDILFICYLHSLGTARFRTQNNNDFFNTFDDILSEIGNRYKKSLSGYWFDCWYQIFEGYPDIPFEKFYKITKKGNKNRIICLNSWVYPSVSPWQDYWAGETASPIAIPVNGFLKEGPVTDLRYQVLLVMEPYWVQEKAEMPEPRFSSKQLVDYINSCSENGGAVTVNMGIYQNGKVGEKALQVMREVKEQIRFTKKQSF